jgi:hypothetical protein
MRLSDWRVAALGLLLAAGLMLNRFGGSGECSPLPDGPGHRGTGFGKGIPSSANWPLNICRRLSRSARLFLAIEGGEGGAPDEFDLVSGLQVRIADRVFLKFDNQLGIMSKSTDWAPQLGVMFSFP